MSISKGYVYWVMKTLLKIFIYIHVYKYKSYVSLCFIYQTSNTALDNFIGNTVQAKLL